MNRKFLFLSAFLLSVVAAVGCADWKKTGSKVFGRLGGFEDCCS